jgi:hypothetical protein
VKQAILLLLLILASPAMGAQSVSGLETDNYKYVAVHVVVELAGDASKIGLTEDSVRTHVESRLRSAGLTPGDARLYGTWLYVNVRTGGTVYLVDVAYDRQVTFEARGQRLGTVGVVWHRNVVGTTGGSHAYIIRGLDQLLDAFLNDYLRANQK